MVPDNDPDSILDRVVQDFVDAQLQGRETDIEEIVRAHPELERRIRQRIQSLQEVDDLFAGLVQDTGNLDTAAFDHDLIGRRLGDFEVLRLIGKGGMGAVFLARQVSLGREVALKVIADVGGSQSKSLERFRREATVLAQLSHPHIVPIHDIGQEGPYAYFAMEYVRGVSLDAILAAVRRAGPAQKASEILRRCFTPPVADDAPGHRGQPHTTAGAQIDRDYIVAISNIVVEVASALQYAHGQGILHRDVKPSNILIDPDGRAKLVDFGLARAQSHPSLTVTGEFFGTPNYVSPEQIRDPESADGRSDVYSLAATYYECLTLRRPFEGDTVNETLTNVLSREVVPPRRYSPRLAPDLNTVLLHALEKQPQDRYQSAADFAADILNVLEFRPIRAKRPPATTRVCRAIRRNSRAAALILMAALLCIAAYVAVSKGRAYQAYHEAQKLYEIGLAKKGAQSYAEAISWFERARTKAPEYVDAYLGSAECYRLLREYDRAEQLCRKAIAINTGSAMAHYQLGVTMVSQKKWEQGALALERAVALQPDLALAHLGLATCYGSLKIEDKALTEFCLVLSIDPNFPGKDRIALQIGTIAAEIQQYSAAIDAYHQALQANPSLAEAYMGLGYVYRLLERPAEAEEAFKKASLLMPENLKAVEGLAQVHLNGGRREQALNTLRSAAQGWQHSGKYAEALQLYNQALAIDGNDVQSLLAAGDCYQKAKDYDKAIAALQRAAACASNDPGRAAFAHVSLGQCLREMGRNDDATRSFLNAIAAKPDYVLTYSILGAHYGTLGRPLDAIEAYKNILRLEPNNWRVEDPLGDSYAALGNYSEAVRHYDRYLTFDPDNPRVLLQTGICCQYLGDHSKAIEYLQHALKADPRSAIAYGAIGYSYLTRGNHFEALSAYTKALAFEPNNPSLRGVVAECYEKLGILDQAIQAYNQVLAICPLDPLALSRLAAIYATADDARLRNGRRAVELAVKACDLTQYRDALCLSTLAAARAECADFEGAIQYQEKAVQLASSDKKTTFEGQLAAYRAGKPWRKPVPK